ncbi:MAG: NAD(P)/FAD-dependent oxidoreductase [Gemmatimonadota bacterium]|nr:NAD(P)/FAD-dependent oxidoreductase [Gemmatimonadota bacterium]
MASDDIRDLIIIGGGPTGLFGAFYAGLRGLRTAIIDSLPELGGQLTALYPEKYVFDVGGIPRILAKDLARDLVAQGLQFGAETILDEELGGLQREDDHWRLVGRTGEYRARALLIAGGKGAFEPRHLEVPGYHELMGRGVYYAVKDPESYRGKRVVIVGGGDSALDWTLALKDVASQVVLLHRRDGFRAHEQSVEALQAAVVAGTVDLRTFHEVRCVEGRELVEAVTVFDNRTDLDDRLAADALLCFLGFKPDLGPIKEWGLDIRKNRILVTSLMETNLQGVYAAGDIVDYDGKLDLIATGFAEAAIAVNNAARFLDPSARVNPGHSTNLKIFENK